MPKLNIGRRIGSGRSPVPISIIIEALHRWYEGAVPNEVFDYVESQMHRTYSRKKETMTVNLHRWKHKLQVALDEGDPPTIHRCVHLGWIEPPPGYNPPRKKRSKKKHKK